MLHCSHIIICSLNTYVIKTVFNKNLRNSLVMIAFPGYVSLIYLARWQDVLTISSVHTGGGRWGLAPGRWGVLSHPALGGRGHLRQEDNLLPRLLQARAVAWPWHWLSSLQPRLLLQLGLQGQRWPPPVRVSLPQGCHHSRKYKKKMEIYIT